ncbi:MULTISPECIES: CDP-alcohol phosphatidyltransferase family protein [unclassified Nocardiopsis]|uniref:CDP-alcohol phosphatidyltransferase family protein n=1 Tax=unclassified Nocardiopsis TaxID=2649073 RepID=UPI001F4092FA|nr:MULTISPECIES: CDP-alcohol phosphatidyltransferase family protein [unclassified Nocardiopsis]
MTVADDRWILAAAACAQAALLGALALTVGLDPAGWAAGIAYLVLGTAVLARAAHRSGWRALGPAGLVTLTRCVLVGAVVALVAVDGPVWPVVALASAALVLDLADGAVARATGTQSAFGARFDMEADAFLILVLSVHAALLLGPWVVAVGGMRYAFWLAGLVLPWLRAPLPPSRARKAVAAVQGAALVAVAARVLPHEVAAAVAVGALAALVWSFGRDVLGLWRRRAGTGAPEEPWVGPYPRG